MSDVGTYKINIYV